MGARSCVMIIAFFTFIHIPKTTALRKTSSDLIIEDQRTHRRQNYVVKRALKDEIFGIMNNIGPAYISESFEPDTGPEVLDYDKMIRNDIILVDNSIKTTSLKRGINTKNQGREVLQVKETECNCELGTREISLGYDYNPQVLETVICNPQKCNKMYHCQEKHYYVKLLTNSTETDNPAVKKLGKRNHFPNFVWRTTTYKVTTGCNCLRDVIIPNPTNS